MYAIIVFTLALLSPMPFLSPFEYSVQDAAAQSPFGPSDPTTAANDRVGNTGHNINGTAIVPFELALSPSISPGPLLTNMTLNDATFTNTHAINSVQINGSTYIMTSSSNNTVHIIDITDIDSPRIVNKTVFYDDDGNAFDIKYIAISTIDGDTYAISSDADAHSVLIINISNPESPSLVTYVTDGQNFTTLASPTRIAITTMDAFTYALVASRNDNGVQIINITDPVNPTSVITIKDKENGGEYDILQRAEDIAIIHANGLIYALVTANADDGVQIINITNISNPIPVSSIVDDNVNSSSPYTILDGAFAIDTIEIGGSIYALVASFADDGIQIINVTNPENISAVSVYHTVQNGVLDQATDITTITLGESIYALVTSFGRNSVNIIDITNPKTPLPVIIADNLNNYTTLTGANHIITVTINSSAYALVTAMHDTGIQIINLGFSDIYVNGNNSNPAYAKAGDNLSIGFMVTDTIGNGSATILGIDAHVSHVGKNFTASIIVPSTEQEGYANFMATLENNYNDTINLTQDNLVNSNIFVDTKRPQISLIGDADLTVFPFTEESSIPGATVTDGDPNYTGTYTPTTNGTLSEALLGSVIIFTYTAANDSAGNVGHSINRTVTIGQPNIIHFTSLSIASSSSDNFARAGQNITVSLVTDGSEIGNFTGTIFGKQFTNATNGGSANFTVMVTPDDPYGNATFLITLTNTSGNNITVTNSHITDDSYITVDAVSPTITLRGYMDITVGVNTTYVDRGATAYDASYGNIMVNGTGTVNSSMPGTYTLVYKAPDDAAGNTGQMVNRTVTVLPKPFELALSPSISPGPLLTNMTLNDATFTNTHAINSVQINGSTYIMTSSSNNTVHIIDITDIDSPRIVNKTVFYDDDGNAFDIKYIAISTIDGDTYAISSDADAHSVLIINISNPESPSLVTYVTDGQNFTTLASPTRIAITTMDAFTYALVASRNDNGVQIINITDPVNPTSVITIKDKENGGEYDILQRAEDIAIIHANGLIYALVTANADDGVQIINITNISNPIPVSSIVDDNVNSLSPYTILDGAFAIDTIEIGGSIYALVASFADDGIQIINVTNPENISAVSVYHTVQNGVLDQATDITTITLGESIYALVTSFGRNSVNIIDITNPKTPLPVIIADNLHNYTTLTGANHIITVTINSSAYALVTAMHDTGIQIINLGFSDIYVNSNNSNPAYAKAGDNLSIGFMVTDTIGNGSATILGIDAHVSHVGKNFTASIIVPSTEQEGYANFMATLENNYNDTINLTQDNLVNSNIFVDTISPTITLNGNANHTVFVNSSYIDLGAVTSDGDPSYTYNYTITNSSSLNTAMVGSFVVYTYTAHTDAAGNLGESINRTVTIVDYNPLNVTNLTVNNTNSINNNYAKAGDVITITLDTDGTDVGNATGDILGDVNFTQSSSNGTIYLTKTITQNDTNGNLTFSIRVINSTDYASRVTQENLVGSNIIIDTIPPNITLNGENNTISILNRTYTDANATAYDLSYGEKSILPTGTVNVTLAGNYSLSYTAPLDLAGNAGSNITRNVRVLELPPLALENTIISSNNSNPTYAKAGDTLTLEFTVNDTIVSNTTQFTNPDQIPSVTINNATYNATLTVPSDPIEDYANFTITVENNQTIRLSVTENDFATNVFIDTIPPRIELVGNSVHTVFVGTKNLVIPGAIAKDGSPKYFASNYTVTNDSLDTETVGSTANYTYTAHTDAAGNLGESINRTVTIVDYNPLNVTNLTVNNTNSINNNYAKAGDVITITLDTDGTDVGNATGDILGDVNFTQSSSNGTIYLTKTITQNDTNGNLTFSIRVINSTDYASRVTQENLVGSNIIIDTIPPNITLNGENNTISILNRTYTDANATAYDLSYGEKSILPTGTVNVTLAGNYSLSYTAPLDLAGNAGSNITRNVRVLELPPLALENTIISSNNSNPTYAKAGDTLTLEFTVNDTIVSNTTQFTNPDQIPSVTINNATYNATLTVPSDPIEDYANFTITVENNQTIRLSVTENDFATNVFIDTIPPRIELVGNSVHTVFVGTKNLVIPGAIAKDGSPKYFASNYTVTNDSLDTETVGSTANYTYTAHTDAAGNLGESINRTVTIVDYNPLNVTNLTVNNTNSINNNYAKAGDVITITLDTDGTDVGNATGDILGDVNFTQSSSNGTIYLTKTITQNDTNGNLTFSIRVINSTDYASRVTQENLVGSNIIIDTIPPNITLNGENNTISILNRTYTDANATAYDLSYGEKSILPTGTVNVTLAGNYSLSYTAPLDLAGNAGSNITRNVRVLELPPLALENTIISSNNSNPTYAKAGDTLTLEFTVNDTIVSNTTQFTNPDQIPSVTINNATYNATLTVPSDPIEDYANFTITVENNQTIRLSVTENDFATNVFIDTIPPRIELVGNSVHTVFVGTKNLVIPGAIAKDGSPKYFASNYTVTNDSLDTETVGSTANYTYTAHTDAAGNLGESINRTVTIVDYNPLNVTNLTVNNTNSINNNYAKAGDVITITLDTDGTDVGNATGDILGDVNFTQSSSGGTIYLTKTITQNDTNGNLTFSIRVINSTDYASRVTQENLVGSNIIIDTIPPNITLNGENNTISILNRTYTDANATAYDLSYGEKSILPTGTVNVTLAGNYSLSYTAPLDLAGNAGSNITRNVRVLELPPLALENTIISSNNSNPTYAKAGDTLTLEFTVNDTIVSNTTQFTNPDQIPSVTINNATYNATLTVPSDPIEDYANFTITVENNQTIRLSVTENDFATNVFIDTIPPRIELVGNSVHTVFVGTKNLVIPGAIAKDGSPKYFASNYTVTNDSLDTETVGSTANYTYTAHTDAAGNLGESINRTVTIVDYNPLNVTNLTVNNTNSINNNYAKAGDVITITLDTDGTDVGNATGDILGDVNFTQSSSNGTIYLTKTITQNDTNGNLTFSIRVINSTDYASRVTQENLVGSNIIIDTIPPNITLNGENNTISILNRTYTDANATAYDLSYGEKSILPTGTVNVTLAGNYSLSYTAPLDLAGNAGSNITRNVRVLELPPLALENTIISSNNSNPTYAKAGDTLTLEFTVNDTIVSNTTQFTNPDQIPSVTINNATYNATLTVPSDPIEDYANFTITVENNQTIRLSVTENDFATNVFIDTIPPRIELVGNSVHTVFVGTKNLVIPGAIAKDGSPKYFASNYTVTNDSLDTETVGSTANYTYTAHTDAAGNLGESINRTVTIVDYNPLNVTNLTVNNTNSINNNYAKAGDVITITLDTDGTDVGNATGDILGDVNFTQSSSNGTIYLTKTITQNDTNGNLTFSIRVINSTDYASRVTQENLVGSNIIIDTIPPNITLNGENNTISILNRTYTDANATAYDLSYGEKSILPTGTVNVTLAGNYSLSYTAPLDLAGNAGSNITRNVRVLELPPLALENTIISSNNSNPTYAKAGDTLTLEFTVNDTIVSNTTQFTNPDQIPSVTINNATYNATLTVPSDPIEDYANFTITVENNQTIRLSVTENDFATNVFIDTIPPRIELVGNSVHTVFVGTKNLVIPGAIAKDGSPKYFASNYTVTNDSLDTETVGSTANYTYTAHTDAAGNLGESINRTVTIVDYNPLNVTNLTVNNTNSINNNYAKAGDVITITLDTDGTDVGNATGDILGDVNFTQSSSGGTIYLTKTITQNDTNGNLTFSIRVINSTDYASRVTQENLVGSNIIIDTIPPNITLNGENNTISILNRTYTDANATAYDLSYGEKSILPTGTVNVTLAGNYSLSYTAPLDLAGNAGSNITRNVRVLELPPLALENTIISSNNSNPTYAKAGDTLTLEFTVNDTIVSNTTQFTNPDQIPSVTINNATYNATLTVPSDPIEDYANFTITVENNQTIRLSVTENDFATNVFIDTIPPRIELVGNSVHTVFVGTKNLVIPGAIAKDGSPKYFASNYTVTNDSLDTETVGSTANYTYTAHTDAAGNLGESINRTVTIVDYNPLNVTNLTVNNTNSINNNYAKAGDVITITLDTDGTDVGNATGDILGDVNFTQSSSNGTIYLTKTITQNDTNGNLTFSIRVINSTDYASRVTQENLVGSNIIIDTIPPNITLNGENNTISILNRTYTDANATAYDLSYGEKSILPTGTVNVTLAGNYSLSYTAPLDLAGNAGSNITRNVRVLELPPLALENTIISSNNSNPTYAKAGDTLTLEFTVNDTIVSNTTQFTNPDQIPSVTINNATYNATLTVPSDPIEDYANFTITVENNQTIRLSVTENDFATNVFIDTIPPRIELVGNSVHTVFVGTKNLVIPGAIAKDGSPKYFASNYTVTNDSLDTETVGSTANYTYTAHTDAAGNLGESINRTVTIVDYNPLNVTNLTVNNTNSINNNYAKAGDVITITLDTDGSDITNTTGSILGDDNFTQNSSGGTIYLTKTITQNDTNGNLTFSIRVINSTDYASRVTQENLVGSNIIIDTIPPNITLNGENNTISILNRTYTDANATAYDLSYGEKSILPTGTVNVTLAGNYSLSYTAPLDLAGNAGSNITRNVRVLELPPLALENTIISSSNSNPTYAKAGDTLILEFTVNDTIVSNTTQFTNPDQIPSVTINNATYIATLTVPSDPIEDYANFTITVENNQTIRLSVTENDFATNVFIDTIPPRIELVGNSVHTVFVGTKNLVIPGAIAKDGSPKYFASNYTVTNDSLDTETVGSTANYTYTAHTDAAGNLGESINRTVTVIDPIPLAVTNLTVNSTNSVNNNYAKAGDVITITLDTDGSDITNTTGSILGDDNFTQNSSGGTIYLTKTITQNDTNGNITFDIFVTNSSEYVANVTQNNLTSSNIIIDTIPPNITLNGNNETTIEYGSTYTDPGANATDASYENTMIIYSNNVVNTSMIGTYPLVYTALDDSAGNLGPSITRIITVSDSTPVMLNSLRINTSNNNPAYAKTGDIIAVTLIANQPISNANTSIQNMAVNNTIQGNTLYANYTVQNSQQGNLTFEITAYFDSSLPLTVSESNLNSSIFIDTEKPKITLVGSLNITVPTKHNYVDDMANVTDNDPSYNGIVYSNASGINTTKSDTYTIVYSADADGAGNIPDNATRTVIVSDFILSISSNNTNYDNLAKKGDLVTIQLVSNQYINASITNATILGRSADATSIIGNTIYANTTIQDLDINGNITFSIIVDPVLGHSVNFTHDDLTYANVIVDTSAPRVLSATTITSNLVSVTFDEPITTYSYTPLLIDITPLPASTNVKNGSSIPYSILEIALDPTPPLSSDATPLITFERSAITDLAGNRLQATSVTASDGIAPSLQSVIIVSSALIEVIFDEKIKLAPGYFRISPTPTVNGISSSPVSSISGNTLSMISPTNSFPTNIAVNVTVASAGIIDEVGNAFEPNYILLNDTRVLTPYTITKTMIIVPYAVALDPNTLSTDDYRVSFGSNLPSTISTVQFSSDTNNVIITMQIPFRTDATPLIEQPGLITDTFGNAVTMQSTIAHDRTPPIFVSVTSSSTSSVTVTFSEVLSLLSSNIANYDSIGLEIRTANPGIVPGTVILSTSPFLDGGIRVSSPVLIEDASGNKAQEGSLQNIVPNQ